MRKLFIISFIILLSILLYSQQTRANAKDTKLMVFVQYDAKANKCSQTTNDQVNIYRITDFKAKSGITDYKISYSSKPKNLSDETVRNAIGNAFSTIQGANNGTLFHYADRSRELKPTADNQNSIMWLPLGGGMVATTYVWVKDGRVKDVDTVFNRRLLWNHTYYTGSNDCAPTTKTYDLRNIATHEFGHWLGLVDIYEAQAKDLTMYGFASFGELKKDSLGLGDIKGIKANWP